MKDHRRLLGALEQKLPQDIGDNGYGEKGQKTHCTENPYRLSRAMLAELVEKDCEETHDCKGITPEGPEGKEGKVSPVEALGYLGRKTYQLSVQLMNKR